MPQLSSGQTASLVLDPGESYTVSATGTATVKGIYGAPATTTTLTANFATFGPYGVPAKLDIACTSGAASYTLDQYEGDLVRSKTNPFTGGLKSLKAGELPLTPLSLAGEITIQSRDLQGRVTTFWMTDVEHTVTYGPHGVASVTAAGVTTTYTYSTSGLLQGSTQS